MRSTPFGGEDSAFRFYLDALNSASIPGRDPFEDLVIQYAQTCPKCGRRDLWGKDTRGVERCLGGFKRFRCGTARPSRFVRGSGPRLKGRASGRSGNLRIERVADLGLVFSKLHLWEFRTWESRIFARSYQRAFHELREMYPRRIGGWSLRTVRSLTDDARDRARPMLERRGFI